MVSTTEQPGREPNPAAIRAAREAAGLSQTSAGALVHSALRTWQQWEAGARRMHSGLWELFRIKAALIERPSKSAYPHSNQDTQDIKASTMKLHVDVLNSIVEQLSHTLPLLAQGRGLGIEITASLDTFNALGQSDHPARDAVLANLRPLDK
jgi:putative transcriptional regulator